MKKYFVKKLALVLAVAATVACVGCGNNKTEVSVATSNTEDSQNVAVEVVEENETAEVVEEIQEAEEVTNDNAVETAEDETVEVEATDDEASVEAQIIGEGQTVFMFEVVDGEGNEQMFEVHTDKTTVGEALLDCQLIEGEDSEYGLYVKTVNGVTADYDVDQTYWAFYVDGAYAQTGVDSTDVVEGSTYSFKVEK